MVINIIICVNLFTAETEAQQGIYSKPHKQVTASRIAPSSRQQLQCSTSSPAASKDIKQLPGDWGNSNTGSEEAQKADLYCSVTLYDFHCYRISITAEHKSSSDWFRMGWIKSQKWLFACPHFQCKLPEQPHWCRLWHCKRWNFSGRVWCQSSVIFSLQWLYPDNDYTSESHCYWDRELGKALSKL